MSSSTSCTNPRIDARKDCSKRISGIELIGSFTVLDRGDADDDNESEDDDEAFDMIPGKFPIKRSESSLRDYLVAERGKGKPWVAQARRRRKVIDPARRGFTL